MKSIVNKQSKPKEFPRLMIQAETKLIVLFSSEATGTVVGQPTIDYSVGHHSKSFLFCNFIDFEGSVTLSND